MKLCFLDPAPVVAATGVLTPLGAGAAAIDVDPAARARGDERVALDLAALTGESPLRFRRMDRYATLGFAAATLALRAGPVERRPEVDSEWGLCLGSRVACWTSNAEFFLDLGRLPVTETSPALFARTVPNAVNGEISIAHRIGGPNQTFVSGWTAGAEALCEAAHLVASGQARQVIAGGIEAPDDLARRMLAAVLQEQQIGWFTKRLAEAAAICILESAAGPVPGRLRMCAFGRAFDPSGTWSLMNVLEELQSFALSTVIVANSVPPEILDRWRRESAAADFIVLPDRTGEIGAAGAPAAVAVACLRAHTDETGSGGALVVARGLAGETVALALAP